MDKKLEGPTKDALEVSAFVAAVPTTLRPVFVAARARIKMLVPHAVERVRPGWGLLGFSAPKYFAFLAPSTQGIRLGFEHGVLLDDSWGLLRDTGSQVRSVYLNSLEAVEHAGVAALILQAEELSNGRHG